MKNYYRATSILLVLTFAIISGAFAQKVSNDLLQMAAKQQARTAHSSKVPQGLSQVEIAVHDGYVVVEATASLKLVNKLKAELEGLGMKEVASYGPVVSGLFPVSRISALENVKALHYIRPSYQPETKVGTVTSQSFTALNVDKVRELYGFTGQGVKIGILSDSYNTRGGAAAGEASGDLPPVEILDEFDFTGIDEGRAMTELVHDIAPDAEIAFHTAFEGQASFAQGIIDLQEAGCKIIVDDVGYLTEPYFQDGIIAQAVDEVSKRGAAYFSSAGNSANDAFEDEGTGRFVETMLDFTGFTNLSNNVTYDAPLEVNAYDFKGDGQLLKRRLTLRTGQNFTTSLQWTDNYFSATGDPDKAALTDLDFYLIFPQLGLLFSATNDNINVTGDPVEFNGVTWNGGGSLIVDFVVVKKAGPDPELVRYIDRAGQAAFAEVVDGDGAATIYGHSNAALGYAVGATRYDTTPRFRDDAMTASASENKGMPNGVEPPVLERFSSVGGIPIYFEPDGRRNRRPKVRKKPDFVASQGDNTTFFGFDYEGDGFPNFFGTSASAPNAAAIAALIVEALRVGEDEAFVNTRGIAPRAIGNILGNTALDMDNPYTVGFDKGFDFASGKGFISALDAIAAVLDDKKNARMAQFGKSSDLFTSTDNTLGKNTIFNLFPSRTSTYVNLFVQQNDDQEVTISIINTLGREVLKLARSGSVEERLYLNEYGKGVYIARFNAANGQVTRKFIIE